MTSDFIHECVCVASKQAKINQKLEAEMRQHRIHSAMCGLINMHHDNIVNEIKIASRDGVRQCFYEFDASLLKLNIRNSYTPKQMLEVCLNHMVAPPDQMSEFVAGRVCLRGLRYKILRRIDNERDSLCVKFMW